MKYTTGLKKNADFQEVYRKGKSAANRLLVLYISERDDRQNRIGISVSKKVGNSVVRHRLKRLIRESYRLNENQFVGGLDMIFIARPGARESTFSDMESALLHLMRRMKLIRDEEESERKS